MQLGKRKTIGGRKLTTFANILVVDKKDRRNRLTKWDTKPKSRIILFRQEHYGWFGYSCQAVDSRNYVLNGNINLHN